MSENKFQFDHLVRELSPPLVVVDEELQSIALVEAALVRHRVDENERVRPLQLTVQVFDLPRNGGLGKAVCFQTVQVGCLESGKGGGVLFVDRRRWSGDRSNSR